MSGRRDALDTIADLLGVPRDAVRAVERRRNGDFAILLRARAGRGVPRWAWCRRVLRIPARRVYGYMQRSPYVRPRDARARRKVNAERFAWWLYWRLHDSAPVVERALDGDLDAIAEFRAAIIAAAPPEPEPELGEVVFFFAAGSNGNGRAAA